MSILRSLASGLRALFGKSQAEREMDEELRGFLDEAAKEKMRSGMSREEALRAARVEMGSMESVKEGIRGAGWESAIETLFQDLRYAVRQLRHNRGFAVVAILTLALGIGANTAIFSLIDTVMLRLLPVQKPEELALVAMRGPKAGGEPQVVFANPLWEQLRDQQDVFSGVFAWGSAQFDLAQGGAAHYVNGLWVSGGFFQTLGLRPASGRLIAASDDQRGCAGAAVLSYGFWQEHFAGAESAVGSTISLDNHSYPIIGVAPPEFFGVEVGTKFDVALPICATAHFDGARPRLDQRSWWWLKVIGRPKLGIGPEQLKARLALLSPPIFTAAVPPNWDPADQNDFRKRSFLTLPAATGTSGLRREFDQPLRILMAVVGLVLLIACANIASLMLARATARGREIAVRRALGASRFRMMRQLLTDCVLLSATGAVLGLFFARWGNALLVHYISTQRNQVFLDFSLDWRVLGFTAAAAVVTGILFGILPAFRSTRVSLTAAMKGSQATDSEHHTRFRSGKWIVASQVALSLVVVMSAGLLLRSFLKLVTLDIGFDRDNVLVMHAEPRTANIPPDQWASTWEEIGRRLRGLPGVISSGRAVMTPVSGFEWNQFLHADLPNAPSGEASLTYLNSISPGYLETLRITLLAGRDFNGQDSKTAPRVAIVNQTLARRFYPDLNPVGRYFRLEEEQGKLGQPIQIVGVVKDFKYASLREGTFATAFFPVSQEPGFGAGPNFLIRAAGRPSGIVSLVQDAVTSVNQGISLDFHTLSEQVDDSLVQERLLATLSAFFGGLALLLATIGLYGTISYMVTQRYTEFGIRLALGAQPRTILGLVMRDVGAILAGGLLAGTSIALATTQVLQKTLFGLGARDPVTLVLAVAVLAAAAFVAGYVPARRAARVDPMVALRYE